MLPDNHIGSRLDDENLAVFASLCRFVWIQGEPLPLVYNVGHGIYAKEGITLSTLRNLEAAGLIFIEQAGYVKRAFGRHTRLFYFGKPTKIQFPQEADNQLDLGHVLLTNKGKALATTYEVAPNQEFYEYVIQKWFEQGLIMSSILPKR
jgi:hypothetical protein